MERLTKRDEHGHAIKVKSSRDTYICTILEEEAKFDAEILERLAEYEDAEEVGTLIKLPCKVGAFVWVIKEYPFGRYRIEGVEIVGFIWPTIDSKPWPADRFGDAYSEIFHRREDAEKRLKELQEKEDGK